MKVEVPMHTLDSNISVNMMASPEKKRPKLVKKPVKNKKPNNEVSEHESYEHVFKYFFNSNIFKI